MKIGKVILKGDTDIDHLAELNCVVHLKKQMTFDICNELYLLKGIYSLETDIMASLKTQLHENR